MSEKSDKDTPTKSDNKTPKKGKKGGQGLNFKAKLIGIEEVAEARGDKMCQEAMQKLKLNIKATGEHKPRIIINVSLEGMKVLDEKSGSIVHHHAVHRISFISRDITDSRAFGYVYGAGEGKHKFFGIKTEKAAEGLVLSLRDLFQVVFEMKKKEMEEAKKAKEQAENEAKEQLENEDKVEVDKNLENGQDSKSDSAAPDGKNPAVEGPQDPGAKQHKAEEGGGIGNLLDLENELQTIEQGIAQMNAFSDPFVAANGMRASASSTPDPFGSSDSWGSAAVTSPGLTTGATTTTTAAAAAFAAFPSPTSDPFTIAVGQTNTADAFSAAFPPVNQPTAAVNDPFNVQAPVQSSGFPAANADPFGAQPFSSPAAAPAPAGFANFDAFGTPPPVAKTTTTNAAPGFDAFSSSPAPAPAAPSFDAFGSKPAVTSTGGSDFAAFGSPQAGGFNSKPAVTSSTEFAAFGSPQAGGFNSKPAVTSSTEFAAFGSPQAGSFNSKPAVTSSAEFAAFDSPQAGRSSASPFGGSPQPPRAKVQADPFKNDPFFSSSPVPAVTSAAGSDRYSVFSSMSSQSSLESSGLGTSSTMTEGAQLTTTMSSTATSVFDSAFGSSGNSVFSSSSASSTETPSQPSLGMPPSKTKLDSAFGDLCELGKDRPFKQKEDFFADVKKPPKPALNELISGHSETAADAPAATTGQTSSSVTQPWDSFGVSPLTSNPSPSSDPFAIPPAAATLASGGSLTTGTSQSNNASDPFAIPTSSLTAGGALNQPPGDLFGPAPDPPVPAKPQRLGNDLFGDMGDDFSLPSPSAPPPPLPSQGTIDLPDVGPAPPPRPNQSVAGLKAPPSASPRHSPHQSPAVRPRQQPTPPAKKVIPDPFANDPFFTSGSSTVSSIRSTPDPSGGSGIVSSSSSPNPFGDALFPGGAGGAGASNTSSSSTADPFAIFNTQSGTQSSDNPFGSSLTSNQEPVEPLYATVNKSTMA